MQQPDEAKDTTGQHLAAHHAHTGLISRAVAGAFWGILSGTSARLAGILGTLAITHYLNPDQFGEVSLAALVMVTAAMVSNCGLTQYVVARPKAGREAAFHVTFYLVVTGAVALAGAVLLGNPLGRLVNAPGIVKYLPGFAVAAFLERIATIQDRIQIRDLRFRAASLYRSAGEFVYAFISVGLAAFASGTPFGGGAAIMWASITRGIVRVVLLSLNTDRREWLQPCKITWERTREIFAFGVPMALAMLGGFGAQRFDNFVFSHHFGQAAVGFYNVAYNFADMPAGLIGEAVGDVLVPSFAHMDSDERRKSTLLLSLRVISLLVTPLAVGLAVVAPTLVKLAFKPSFQDGVMSILRILALFSIARALTWNGSCYLQVRDKPRAIMVLEILRMIAIVTMMHSFAVIGGLHGASFAPNWATAAVVVVFSLSALSYAWVIRQVDGISILSQLFPVVPPLVASIPMAIAVVGVRRLLDTYQVFTLGHSITTVAEQIRQYGPRLVIEILVGAVVFVPSALILSRRSAREVLDLVRNRRLGSAA